MKQLISVPIKGTTLLYILGAIWVSPAAILVWLFYILPIWLIWKDLKFIGWHRPCIARFQLANKDVEPWHRKMWTGWGGVGLPCAFVHKDAPGPEDNEWVKTTCLHEGRHCKQWFVFGVLFPLAYLFSMGITKIRGKRAYFDNHFEVDARRAAGDDRNV